MSIKLSYEKIEKVRATLVDELKSIPEGMHKPIRPDVMESLIFKRLPSLTREVIKSNSSPLPDDKVMDELNKILTSAKLPIWTGPFLSKVDLSKVSFDGAILDFDEIAEIFKRFSSLWSVEFHHNAIFKYLESLASCYCHFESRASLKISQFTLGSDFEPYDLNQKGYQDYKVLVDFSGTNVVIDAKKLFVAKRDVKSPLSLDDLFDYMPDDAPKQDVNSEPVPRITHCSFENADLAGMDWGAVYLENTNLSNTGVAIKIDTNSQEVVNGARSCKLVGCVINGKLVERKKISDGERESILSSVAGLEQQYMDAIGVEAVPRKPRR